MRVQRKAFYRKYPLKIKMANFLWKSDLPFSSLKKSTGVEELRLKAAKEIKTENLFELVLAALKNRYRQRFDSFLKARGSITFIQDIDILTIQDNYL